MPIFICEVVQWKWGVVIAAACPEAAIDEVRRTRGGPHPDYWCIKRIICTMIPADKAHIVTVGEDFSRRPRPKSKKRAEARPSLKGLYEQLSLTRGVTASQPARPA